MLSRLKRFATGDVSVLVASSMAAQALNLLAYPFLTRVYTPADFGIFSAITAAAAFIGAAILLRLDTIYQIAGSDEETDILKAAALTGAILTCLVLAAALIFGGSVSALFERDAAVHTWHWSYAFMVALIALLNGVFVLARQYSAKHGAYRRFAVAQIMRTLLTVGVQLAIVAVWPGPIGLLAGFAIGFAAGAMMAWPFRAALVRAILAAPGQALRSSQAVVQRYRAFITVDVFNVLISASALSAYPIFVLVVFGAHEAGLYAVASRFAFLPVDVLGASISTVYFQRFASALRDGQGMVRLFGITLVGASAAALVMAAAVALIAGPLVGVLFTPEWARMGILILYLLPSFVARFVIGCIGNTPLALKRPGILTGWNIAQVSIIGAALAITAGGTLDSFLLTSGLGLLAAGAIYTGVLYRAIQAHQLAREV